MADQRAAASLVVNLLARYATVAAVSPPTKLADHRVSLVSAWIRRLQADSSSANCRRLAEAFEEHINAESALQVRLWPLLVLWNLVDALRATLRTGTGDWNFFLCVRAGGAASARGRLQNGDAPAAERRRSAPRRSDAAARRTGPGRRRCRPTARLQRGAGTSSRMLSNDEWHHDENGVFCFVVTRWWGSS